MRLELGYPWRQKGGQEKLAATDIRASSRLDRVVPTSMETVSSLKWLSEGDETEHCTVNGKLTLNSVSTRVPVPNLRQLGRVRLIGGGERQVFKVGSQISRWPRRSTGPFGKP